MRKLTGCAGVFRRPTETRQQLRVRPQKKNLCNFLELLAEEEDEEEEKEEVTSYRAIFSLCASAKTHG